MGPPIDQQHATVSFDGPISAVLQAAMVHDLVDLHTRDADLEEIFLAYYRRPESRNADSPDPVPGRHKDAGEDAREKEKGRPMSTEVLTRELSGRRTPIVALGAVLMVFAFFVVGISSGLQTMVSDLTEAMPEAVPAFIPVGPGGYPVGELFNLIAPLALIAHAVMTGAGLILGEEQSGTMAVLSAQPLSRRSILAQKTIGLTATLAGLTAVFAAVAALSAAFFDIEGLTAPNILAACLHLYLLALLFGAVALATGARSPGVPAWPPALAAASPWPPGFPAPCCPSPTLRGGRLSPWYYYVCSEPLANGIDATHLPVLALLTIVVVAFVGFERRDLKG